jgi:hypothetical protein
MPKYNKLSKEKLNLIKTMLDSTLSFIEQGNTNEAYKLIEEFENNCGNDNTYTFCSPAFWIDIGTVLKDHVMVKKGVDIGENLLKDLTFVRYKSTLHYNVANGYTSLFEMIDWKSGNIDIPKSINLQKVKEHFRIVLSYIDGQDANFKIQVLVNYANCLDTLGRCLESLDIYDEALEIDNTFSMAIANRAKAMKFFAEVSGHYRGPIYVEAYQAIRSVINDPNLIKIGGLRAKIGFKKEMEFIESLFKDKTMLDQQLTHHNYDDKGFSDFEKFYIDFCSRENLFLNFHIHHTKCQGAIEDPIFIRIITKANENNKFYNLAKRINQIKEDYATSRLLLVQSLYRKEDIDNLSKLTLYANCSDYSQFNLYMGLLKSSFSEAYNVLDKIAVFINDYYDMGIPQNHIYFASIWHKNNIIRDELLQTKNISLFALYDIYQDFLSGEYSKIQNIRNSLTHRRLVIYDSTLAKWDNIDDDCNIGYNSMFESTIFLLRLVKASVIYLINFVNIKEAKKRKGKEAIITIPVSTSQYIY